MKKSPSALSGAETVRGTGLLKGAGALKGATATQVIASLAAITMVGVAGVAGTSAALTDTTSNEGNEYDAAQIDLTDNDGGAFMYKVDNAYPGEVTERCIRVSYTGTTGSTVKLFMPTPIGEVGEYVDMTVTAGTQATSTFPSCAGFTPATGGDLYTGTLEGFQDDHASAGSGIAHSPNGAGPWEDDDSVVYRVRLTLQDGTRPPGANFSGVHTYTWQADSVR